MYGEHGNVRIELNEVDRTSICADSDETELIVYNIKKIQTKHEDIQPVCSLPRFLLNKHGSQTSLSSPKRLSAKTSQRQNGAIPQ